MYNIRPKGQERGKTVVTGKTLNGKPCEGNSDMRFDAGGGASTATSRRGALLYDKVAEMREILKREFEAGMKGIRFLVDADASTDDFSHDFCELERAIAEGRTDTVYEPCS